LANISAVMFERVTTGDTIEEREWPVDSQPWYLEASAQLKH
jgi:hypothetical protein